MLTFFTTAKPFADHSAIIQRNALQSWKLLHPEVDVILFGDDDGAAAVCAELGLRHEPHVERHESGMKYLNYMIAHAQQIARHEYLCYSNCDIVQFSEFRIALEKILAWKSRFLMVGRRWDTHVSCPINFQEEGWQKHLRELAITNGRQQSADFIDFFVFPRVFYEQVPPLVVGRSYWDHWLVWKALSSGVPVVDCSRFLVAIHQNHGYAYHAQGKQGTNEDALAQRNIELCGGGRHLRSISDATHAMTRRGAILRTPFRRQATTIFEFCSKQGFLNHTYQIRKRLGLRSETIQYMRGRMSAWFGRKP